MVSYFPSIKGPWGLRELRDAIKIPRLFGQCYGIFTKQANEYMSYI